MGEVVAGIHDNAKPLAQNMSQSHGELHPTASAGQDHVAAGLGGRRFHRNKSSDFGRTRDEAGCTSEVQSSPRTKAAGRPSAASPMTRTAIAATASAKATSVTSSGRLLRS